MLFFSVHLSHSAFPRSAGAILHPFKAGSERLVTVHTHAPLTNKTCLPWTDHLRPNSPNRLSQLQLQHLQHLHHYKHDCKQHQARRAIPLHIKHYGTLLDARAEYSVDCVFSKHNFYN